ncbi:hypothetical protein [Sphingomonas solaris]|uniref:Glycosyltransferase family 1 protein n=1 Tax=Alterirhizorhabdus solaris TaxID=2529389 RepID=A0A558QYF7_9SPHN|nr:hypothetical protein [Sphingomonas solaris]TVV72097.1 hypothetical protein FOY91_15335 [Sphingomonas solaris]
MTRPFVACHFALVQDVAVLRPLARLAASLPGLDLRLIVSEKFIATDINGRWMAEIERLGAEVGVAPFLYQTPFEAIRHLGDGRGMIVAGSESMLAAHVASHDLFRAVPGRIRTVTLQHGLECVGFLHNARHDAVAGRDVRFAADIAVAWFDMTRMESVSPAERAKMFVAGPSIMIDPSPPRRPAGGDLPGLICENLHSVRFVNGRMREGFLDSFLQFAGRLAMVDQSLALRAHPAGRFTERNAIALPANVQVSTAPLYDVALGDFAYAISAPSTILFDFVLAGVPVATWVDPDGEVDTRHFDGLAQVSSVDDWWRFNWAARWDRAALVERQDRYRDGLGIPADVRGRYLALLSLAG